MKSYSAFGILAATALCLTLSACGGGSGSPAGAPSTAASSGASASSGGTGTGGTTAGSTSGGATGSTTGGTGSATGTTGGTAGGSVTGGGSTGGSSGSTGSGLAACTGSQVTVGVGAAEGAAGHQEVALSFTNVSGTPCTLHGYPGVAALDSGDHQVAQATRSLRGMMGGAVPGATAPATITVPAHGRVSARLEWSDVPQGGLSQCPTYAGVLVTPPGTTTSTRIVSVQPVACTLQIHPVVPGSTGDQE
jgi:hypothetical protein